MVLTDGSTYGKTIYLADGADKEKFYEITQADYDKMLEEESEEMI